MFFFNLLQTNFRWFAPDLVRSGVFFTGEDGVGSNSHKKAHFRKKIKNADLMSEFRVLALRLL